MSEKKECYKCENNGSLGYLVQNSQTKLIFCGNSDSCLERQYLSVTKQMKEKEIKIEREKQEQIERDRKEEERKKKEKEEDEKNTCIYVVYWVDLDDDCLKKSEIKILGAFDNKGDADELSSDYEHEGYCDDSRCYYTSVTKVYLNKISDAVQMVIDNNGNGNDSDDSY